MFIYVLYDIIWTMWDGSYNIRSYNMVHIIWLIRHIRYRTWYMTISFDFLECQDRQHRRILHRFCIWRHKHYGCMQHQFHLLMLNTLHKLSLNTLWYQKVSLFGSKWHILEVRWSKTNSGGFINWFSTIIFESLF